MNVKVTPYLNFNGQCAEAFRFYEQLFGGKIEYLATFGETPAMENVPAEMSDRVMHATLTFGGQSLMGSDGMPDRYQKPQGTYVSLHFKDTAEGERIFNALAENGSVEMPFEKTFWAAGFGMLTDRFGIPWMVNCE